MAVKERKISKKDWKTVEQFVKREYESRANSEFRKAHEAKWKEVDRQLSMIPLKRVGIDGNTIGPGWHSEIELGEISKVSEVVTADTMRIIFPAERDWFEPHVELEGIQSEEGPEKPPEPMQTIADNTAKSMFHQQHIDFGFDARFELSVKEALHHGSFVTTAEWYQDMMVKDGTQTKHIGAPVWVPHSMWNCYPDPSPRCIAQNMFYGGSMIIKSYMPRWKLEMQKGEGWMPSQYKDIPEDEHNIGDEGEKNVIKDLEILTYYGDAVIARKSSDDIYLPNSKIVLANGVIVYWAPNELPYPSVIYGGYERQDPRDPYYTSPLIKLSPIGKLASIMANEFVDGIRLRNEPPIVYDSNDPAFAMNGGPTIFPGASHGTKGGADFKQVEIGDPAAALNGMQMCLRVMQEGTGVSAIRSGVPNSDRQTAFEVNKVSQGAEVRTVDFIRKLNAALRTFLYMQHALNLKHLKEYSFYSDDMDSKDFLRITGAQYKKAPVIHFDVVGAKGILGEEQRMNRQTQVTAFASSNPMFAPLLKPRELLLNMYKDAGTKNPERFVNADGQMEDPRLAEMQQVIQQLQGALQQAEDKTQLEIAKIEQKREESIAKLQQAQEAKQMETEQREKDRIVEYTEHIQKLQVEMEMQRRDLTGQFQNVLKDVTHKLEMFEAKGGGPSVTVAGSFDDSVIKEESQKTQAQILELADKVARKKKRTIKFIDDDTAEVVEE